MFRLLKLNLYNHPFLGDLELDFTNNNNKENGPYTSLIIGPNGTGKSEILRIVIDAFREIEIKIKTMTNETVRQSNYVNNKYLIVFSYNGQMYNYSNRINVKEPYSVNSNYGMDLNALPISWDKPILPTHLIANSIMLNDRFPMVNSEPEKMYQYMGIRRTPSSTSTRYQLKKLVGKIIEASNNNNFHSQLKDVFSFLDLKKQFEIIYRPRYRNYIFNKNLTYEKLNDFFKNWKTNLNRETEPYSVKYFNKLDKNGLSKLVEFINDLSKKYYLSWRGYTINFDLFSDTFIKENYKFMVELNKLDLLQYPEINIQKRNQKFDFSNISSGENHLIVSLIGILSVIKSNSLVFIDEPEISLHPNWQMRYVGFLKDVFQYYVDCHFIIASHSHFLVSDLKPESSHVLSLNFNKENKIISESVVGNTYGWSAEDILYKIFNTKTVRNYYVEQDLRMLLSLIAQKSTDTSRIKSLTSKLKELRIDDNDPLNLVLNQAKTYLGMI